MSSSDDDDRRRMPPAGAGRAHALPSNINSLLPRFGGKKKDPRAWVGLIDEVGALYGWSEDLRRQAAWLRLKSKARTFAESRRAKLASWAAFKAALIKRFGETSRQLYKKFYKCKQRTKEDVQTYADRWLKYAEEAGVDPYSSANYTQQFLDGLRTTIRVQAGLQCPDGLDDAIETAHRIYLLLDREGDREGGGRRADTSDSDSSDSGSSSDDEEDTTPRRPERRVRFQQSPEPRGESFVRGNERRAGSAGAGGGGGGGSSSGGYDSRYRARDEVRPDRRDMERSRWDRRSDGRGPSPRGGGGGGPPMGGGGDSRIDDLQRSLQKLTINLQDMQRRMERGSAPQANLAERSMPFRPNPRYELVHPAAHLVDVEVAEVAYCGEPEAYSKRMADWDLDDAARKRGAPPPPFGETAERAPPMRRGPQRAESFNRREERGPGAMRGPTPTRRQEAAREGMPAERGPAQRAPTTGGQPAGMRVPAGVAPRAAWRPALRAPGEPNGRVDAMPADNNDEEKRVADEIVSKVNKFSLSLSTALRCNAANIMTKAGSKIMGIGRQAQRATQAGGGVTPPATAAPFALSPLAQQHLPEPVTVAPLTADGPQPMEFSATRAQGRPIYNTAVTATPVQPPRWQVCRTDLLLADADGVLQRTPCIIDSGASATLVTFQTLRKLRLLPAVVNTEIAFLSADGAKSQAKGKLRELYVSTGDMAIKLEAFVTDAESYNVLIGCDWLAQARASICYDTERLSYWVDHSTRSSIPITFMRDVMLPTMAADFEPVADAMGSDWSDPEMYMLQQEGPSQAALTQPAVAEAGVKTEAAGDRRATMAGTCEAEEASGSKKIQGACHACGWTAWNLCRLAEEVYPTLVTAVYTVFPAIMPRPGCDHLAHCERCCYADLAMRAAVDEDAKSQGKPLMGGWNKDVLVRLAAKLGEAQEADVVVVTELLMDFFLRACQHARANGPAQVRTVEKVPPSWRWRNPWAVARVRLVNDPFYLELRPPSGLNPKPMAAETTKEDGKVTDASSIYEDGEGAALECNEKKESLETPTPEESGGSNHPVAFAALPQPLYPAHRGTPVDSDDEEPPPLVSCEDSDGVEEDNSSSEEPWAELPPPYVMESECSVPPTESDFDGHTRAEDMGVSYGGDEQFKSSYRPEDITSMWDGPIRERLALARAKGPPKVDRGISTNETVTKWLEELRAQMEKGMATVSTGASMSMPRAPRRCEVPRGFGLDPVVKWPVPMCMHCHTTHAMILTLTIKVLKKLHEMYPEDYKPCTHAPPQVPERLSPTKDKPWCCRCTYQYERLMGLLDDTAGLFGRVELFDTDPHYRLLAMRAMKHKGGEKLVEKTDNSLERLSVWFYELGYLRKWERRNETEDEQRRRLQRHAELRYKLDMGGTLASLCSIYCIRIRGWDDTEEASYVPHGRWWYYAGCQPPSPTIHLAQMETDVEPTRRPPQAPPPDDGHSPGSHDTSSAGEQSEEEAVSSSLHSAEDEDDDDVSWGLTREETEGSDDGTWEEEVETLRLMLAASGVRMGAQVVADARGGGGTPGPGGRPNPISVGPDGASTAPRTPAPVELRAPVTPKTEKTAPAPTLEELLVTKVSEELTVAEQEEMRCMLLLNKDIFAVTNSELGYTTWAVCDVDTGDSPPVTCAPYRFSKVEREAVDATLEQLQRDGIIVPSSSAWRSPMLVVPKKGEHGTELRVVVDMRRLNMVVRTESYPLGNIQDILDTVAPSPGQQRYLSSLDLKSGFWQVPCSKESMDKLSFVTGSSQWTWTRMPMGYKNAPTVFAALMRKVLAPVLPGAAPLTEEHIKAGWRKLEPCATVYLDDVVIYSSDFETHLRHVQMVFDLLRLAGLKAAVKKCSFGRRRLVFLGHLIDGEKGTVGLNPKYLPVIMNYKSPLRSVKQVRAFLGTVGYYRKFVPRFAAIAKPLNDLLVKDADMTWGEEQEAAFQELRRRLLEEPILVAPCFDKPFVVQTDFCGTAIAACLAQLHEGPDGKTREHAVQFASKRLRGPGQQHLDSATGEMLAAVWAITKVFRPYLYGKHFILQTDSMAVRYMRTAGASDLHGRFARMALKLMEYDFTVEYRPAERHGNVDGLSRLGHLVNEDSSDDEEDVALGKYSMPAPPPVATPAAAFTFEAYMTDGMTEAARGILWSHSPPTPARQATVGPQATSQPPAPGAAAAAGTSGAGGSMTPGPMQPVTRAAAPAMMGLFSGRLRRIMAATPPRAATTAGPDLMAESGGGGADRSGAVLRERNLNVAAPRPTSSGAEGAAGVASPRARRPRGVNPLAPTSEEEELDEVLPEAQREEELPPLPSPAEDSMSEGEVEAVIAPTQPVAAQPTAAEVRPVRPRMRPMWQRDYVNPSAALTSAATATVASDSEAADPYAKVICQGCKKPTPEHNLYLCAVCDDKGAWHANCVQPPVPFPLPEEVEFYCPTHADRGPDPRKWRQTLLSRVLRSAQAKPGRGMEAPEVAEARRRLQEARRHQEAARQRAAAAEMEAEQPGTQPESEETETEDSPHAGTRRRIMGLRRMIQAEPAIEISDSDRTATPEGSHDGEEEAYGEEQGDDLTTAQEDEWEEEDVPEEQEAVAEGGGRPKAIWEDLAVLVYLQTGQLNHVEGATVELQLDESRRVKRRAKGYRWEDGKLYQQRKNGRVEVPPPERREELIRGAHNVGHVGISRTMSILTAHKLYWPGIKADVAAVIRNCPQCSKAQAKLLKARELRPLPLVGLFDRVSIDTMGPLPRSASTGNKYIAVAVDSFSRWCEVGALPDVKAATLWKWFHDNWVCRLGAPRALLTDRHMCFLGEEFDGQLKVHRIKHLLTSGHHPQTNGLVERLNGSLMASLRALADAATWEAHLMECQLAHNSSRHTSTKVSPALALMGRELRLGILGDPVGDAEELPAGEDDGEGEWGEEERELLAKRLTNMEAQADEILANSEKAKEREIRYYNRKMHEPRPRARKGKAAAGEELVTAARTDLGDKEVEAANQAASPAAAKATKKLARKEMPARAHMVATKGAQAPPSAAAAPPVTPPAAPGAANAAPATAAKPKRTRKRVVKESEEEEEEEEEATMGPPKAPRPAPDTAPGSRQALNPRDVPDDHLPHLWRIEVGEPVYVQRKRENKMGDDRQGPYRFVAYRAPDGSYAILEGRNHEQFIVPSHQLLLRRSAGR